MAHAMFASARSIVIVMRRCVRRVAVLPQVHALPRAEVAAPVRDRDRRARSASARCARATACRPGPRRRGGNSASPSGTSRAMNASRSRRTSGSAFSLMISEALVWCTNTVHSPRVDARAADDRAAARLGQSYVPRPRVLDLDRARCGTAGLQRLATRPARPRPRCTCGAAAGRARAADPPCTQATSCLGSSTPCTQLSSTSPTRSVRLLARDHLARPLVVGAVEQHELELVARGEQRQVRPAVARRLAAAGRLEVDDAVHARIDAARCRARRSSRAARSCRRRTARSSAAARPAAAAARRR